MFWQSSERKIARYSVIIEFVVRPWFELLVRMEIPHNTLHDQMPQRSSLDTLLDAPEARGLLRSALLGALGRNTSQGLDFTQRLALCSEGTVGRK